MDDVRAAMCVSVCVHREREPATPGSARCAHAGTPPTRALGVQRRVMCGWCAAHVGCDVRDSLCNDECVGCAGWMCALCAMHAACYVSEPVYAHLAV